LSNFCAAAAALIGLVRLVGCFTGGTSRLDLLGFHDLAGLSLGTRVFPAAAFGFLLLGGALFLANRAVMFRTFQLLAIIGILIGWVGLWSFFAIDLQSPLTILMPLPSAICFVLFGVGILCVRTDGGLMALLASSSAGGMMARRMLIPVISH
jgi:hypothetical protein